jgi:tRNA/tmRNA/rRNA uracil-C5-methylase (TrmA/RlmC/RlmD family)
MLGNLKLPIYKDRHYVVYGGPYMRKPGAMVGVKMAQELKMHGKGHTEIDIPTRDFCTPNATALANGLETAVKQVLAGRPVYVGCYGGRGRTGLFLAVLAKAFGVESPVEYVRKNYYHHAVETAEQYKFVTQFKIPLKVKAMIALARVTARFKTNRTQLTTIVG